MNRKAEEVDPLLKGVESAVFRSQVPGGRGFRGDAKAKVAAARKSPTGASMTSSWAQRSKGCLGCFTFILLLMLGMLIRLFFFQPSFTAYSNIFTLVFFQSWPTLLPGLPVLILFTTVKLCFFAAICGCLPFVDKNSRNRQFGYVGCTCCCSTLAFAVVVTGLVLTSTGDPSTIRAVNEICTSYSSQAGRTACGVDAKARGNAPLLAKPVSSFTARAMKAGEKVLPIESQNGFLIGNQILIGNDGDPHQTVNTVVALGSLVLQDPLKYDYPANTVVKELSTAATTLSPPALPVGPYDPFASTLVGNRMDRVSPPTPAPTFPPTPGPTPSDYAPLPHAIGAVLVDPQDPSRGRLLADIDLDKEEDGSIGFLRNANIDATRPARRLDSAHDAAFTFMPIRRCKSNGVDVPCPFKAGADAPTVASCADAKSLCTDVAAGWTDTTSCACSGIAQTVNGALIGGYCNAWDAGWGVEPWCFVNAGVTATTCGLVEAYSTPGGYIFQRSPGPCSAAVVSRSKVLLEGKDLYKAALLLCLLLVTFACCSFACGAATVVLGRNKAPTGGNAFLVAPVQQGQMRLEVSQMDGFAPGQAVLIDEGSYAEEVAVIDQLGSLILQTPLDFAHNSGASVSTIPAQRVPVDVEPMMFQDTLNADWSLEDQFRWAQKMGSSAVHDRTPEENKLELYGFYHQAVEGNATGTRPSMLYVDEQHRYDAWNRLRGMPRNEAMRLYIDSVNSLLN